MDKKSQPQPIKLVIIGDGCVGKTCILMSYAYEKFPEAHVPTIFESHYCNVTVDDTPVNLGLWDTAGQEQYSSLRGLAYPNADIFLIAFSVDDPASFDNAIKKWYPELFESAPNVPKVFVGNKIDLRDLSIEGKNAHIRKEVAQQIIKEMKCEYFECSAKTQEGLREIFLDSMRTVLKSKKQSGGKGKKFKKNKDDGCTLI